MRGEKECVKNQIVRDISKKEREREKKERRSETYITTIKIRFDETFSSPN